MGFGNWDGMTSDSSSEDTGKAKNPGKTVQRVGGKYVEAKLGKTVTPTGEDISTTGSTVDKIKKYTTKMGDVDQMTKLNADVLEGFTNSILRKGFDSATGTPDFHRTMWEYCTSPDHFVAIAAPRSHAKSTAITHAYTLAALLFRERDYAIVVSETVAQSVQFLGDIKKELLDNEDLRELFGVDCLIKDTEEDLICRMKDGHLFRVQAKGAEQKVRGLKWKSKRPNLIVCHAEDTEIYTPETGWIKNQDHPTAQRIRAHEAFEVEFEDGTKEIVSGDHRYLVEGKGWQWIWKMNSGDNVIESGIRPIENDTQTELKTKRNDIGLLSKAKQRLRSGMRSMLLFLMLQERSGTWITRIWFFKKLNNLLKNTLLGKLVTVQKDEPTS